ncbi:MAG: hypothetical protein GY742_12585 [Hyphomicrobiales bacterium]|nr:hypothetical protein [Hyphomicrobiales bacterium]
MLKIALVLFLIFVANVGLGSIGRSQFLGDLGELFVVIASVIFFVIAIIQSENKSKTTANSEN